MSSPTVYQPLVYWAQTEKTISLKVDLNDVSSPEVELKSKTLTFKGYGLGASGIHQYEFSLDFHDEVDPDASAFRVLDRQVDFNISKKSVLSFWPRLTSGERPRWLRIDFDRWRSGESDEEEDEDAKKKREQEEHFKELEEQLMGAEKQAYQDIKNVYLFMYNLIQWIIFTMVFVYCLGKFILHGKEDLPAAYDWAIIPLGIAQVFACLEVIHAMTGLVKSGTMTVFMQVFGRNFVLFVVIMNNPELKEEGMTLYLFMVWSAVEVVRYPFYMLSCIDYESEVVTWLRYTVWIPLYPLGFLSEIMVVCLAIPFYKETDMFSVHLPNRANIAFSFVYYMYLHIIIIVSSAPTLLSHMWRLRKKKYGKRRIRIGGVKPKMN
ncbi:very-long-chain (3R)-3-hydroxyacyl-CoA dehydratase 3 [Strongylocentrotus purpuratus]|uniref:Very-long-chain (3R)-3-hydroxyacyl-CoA dehydratase n=1 Tax=Strongylocentrotus purpuratus TaxID=7668 RepID=A0A7M7N861_STRPU|nr:very-long-chain (3R)-3-hydroxyacyl-CoA dehydratase 3 [Strongylocentrotus purpuratus]|eukprot:XP_011668293.1 PREDICTED: very-long-chain (3R)-3-hydroxyacyl-CoA dehydratase 3 [Strongylocentrotus purpuratus]